MTTQDLLATLPLCAICSGSTDCRHESESLELALRQAQDRWGKIAEIRAWVLEHARLEVARIFNRLKRERLDAHHAYLSKLPCYTIYARYQGNPPIAPQQLYQLKVQIAQAEAIFRQGINEDWQRSCLKYPAVLSYFFSLVQIDMPANDDPEVRHPRIDGPRRIRARRDSSDHGRHR